MAASEVDDRLVSVLTVGPSDVVSILRQATAKLQQADPDACNLFAWVTDRHEFREAWLGLAIAHHFRGEFPAAADALSRVLSRHAVEKVPTLADGIADSVGAPGWCALDGAGLLTVQMVQQFLGRPRPSVNLDGRRLLLRPRPNRWTFTVRLPAGWPNAQEIAVSIDGVPLLGSPIDLRSIVRVEGFTDSRNGDLHGWAWCPNDPDRDPELSIAPLDGGPGISVVAGDISSPIPKQHSLARPRGFHIPADLLRQFNGPVRVCGRDGHNLTGSPLDPSEERRSAEIASKTIAGFFPAPGFPLRTDRRELPSPVAAAHVMGSLIQSQSKRRPVDVVVPVYGGLDHTLAGLKTLLPHLPRWARVIVVDDASPDPRVGKELRELEAQQCVTLLTQTVNRGFPETANAGMRHDPTRDIVLLNSDTLVPPGWLVRLRRAAYSAASIGSATPISNNATILSYPSVDHPNMMPDRKALINLDALAQKANDGRLIDIPTAVGFCVYIKRDCLNATGLLRDDFFAQGYGEENDFCIRARHLGWRHVAVPGVFVAHVGGQSFGSATLDLRKRNLRKLNQLHPGYDALVQEFQQLDPMAESRRRLDMERWKTFRSDAESILLITHSRSGGVRRHVAERATELQGRGFRPIMIWPVASRNDKNGRDCVLGNGLEGGTPNLRFAIPDELDLLTQFLRADRPIRAELHHLVGHDHRLLDLFGRLGIPYEMVIHDYASLCPRVHLVDASKRYCGEPDVAVCEACVADVGPMNDEDIPPAALRERSSAEMGQASRVVVPSLDVAKRIRHHFPSIRPVIVSWEDEEELPRPAAPLPSVEGERRICIVGAIGIEKGYEVLLACARDAARRKLHLQFQLVGHSCDDERLLAIGNVQITGRYREHEVVELIQEQHAQLAWLPSVWPETWCYTLTQMWRAGLSVLAFDIGTQAERIRRNGRGWLCPLRSSPQELNQHLLSEQ